MTQSKITIGSPEEWEIFKQSNPLFLEKLELLHSTIEKVFLRTVSSENPADRVVFYLGILCVEDFNEVTLLCGNGCGIGALKILRGLYERAVSLGYIAKNPNKAEDFLALTPDYVPARIRELPMFLVLYS